MKTASLLAFTVLVSACSLLSYAPFLWNRTIVALPLVAFGEFLAVIATGLFFVAIVGRGSERWLRPSDPWCAVL